MLLSQSFRGCPHNPVSASPGWVWQPHTPFLFHSKCFCFHCCLLNPKYHHDLLWDNYREPPRGESSTWVSPHSCLRWSSIEELCGTFPQLNLLSDSLEEKQTHMLELLWSDSNSLSPSLPPLTSPIFISPHQISGISAFLQPAIPVLTFVCCIHNCRFPLDLLHIMFFSGSSPTSLLHLVTTSWACCTFPRQMFTMPLTVFSYL